MQCTRCATELDAKARGPWCAECERIYDTWSRQYAADIVKETGIGALVAMVIGLGLPLLGLEPLIGTLGVLAGFVTFLMARKVGRRKRRQQFLTSGVPRAYLPTRT